MNRFLAFLSCVILLLGLCFGVSAAESDGTRASTVNIFVTVSNDGNVDVTTNITLHLDAPQEGLVYPVPANASNVTLNGKAVLTQKTGQVRNVNISRILGGMSGDFSFTVGYSVNSAVEVLVSETTETTVPSDPTDPSTGPTTKRVRLSVPMLAGFAYPIDDLQFSINVPGLITQNPSFVSGYHQANIEKDLNYTISGGNIAGRSWNTIKDHETLTMHLDTTDEMFPQSGVALPALEKVTPLLGICAGLALLYWILFLRNYLPLRSYPAMAPQGFGAGQLGTVLTMAGPDLSLMIFTWAQLGYVTLRMDRKSRVYVQKRMDMGNERNAFEQKCFAQLFSRRDVVDTSTNTYQRMYQSVSQKRTAQQLFRTKNPGSIKVFRILMAAVGLLSGTCFGILMGNMLDYGWVFMSILSLVGLICSWRIQFWPEGLFLHHRFRLWTATGLSVLWLMLGIVIEQFPMALLAVSLQIVGGFLAAFGGRRTEDGRNALGQTLRLRRYFTKLTISDTHKMSQNNPEAFFDLAPYAMALGCDHILARHFGGGHLPVCPYIQVSDARGLNAQQWSQLMRHILDGMTARQRQAPLEGLRSVLDNYMK